MLFDPYYALLLTAKPHVEIICKINLTLCVWLFSTLVHEKLLLQSYFMMLLIICFFLWESSLICFSFSSFADITTALTSLSPTVKNNAMVQHALALRTAVALSDYHKFFLLYRSAPKMSPYLMDMFVERQRKDAIKAMVKSYVYIFLVSFLVL